jgi:hypothetical protein
LRRNAERQQDFETDGSGDINVASPANNAVAPTVPSRVYMALANNKNAAAKVDRMKLLLARADATIGRYATTI